DYRTGGVKYITITHEEFIRRFLQHVLPAGFQKIRYYGILTNSLKKKRLEIIFRIQNHRRFRSKYSGMETDVKLFEMFGIDIHICPCCGERSLRQCYRTYGRTPSGVS
ncbi:MAG: transposase, partial [Lachnospiraceae bacterium]|nr:transposase [Lachnospiraceae bacterium]